MATNVGGANRANRCRHRTVAQVTALPPNPVVILLDPRPLPGAAHYAASKAAIEQLTRCWALELAPEGVRVNALAPGPTESEALSAAGLTEADVARVKEAEAAQIPLGRRGEPDEVAQWVLRLADPGTTWLTGQVLTIDGGLELT